MDSTRPELPLARTDQLIVKEADEEVLVYDLRTDQAHCLNRTAGLVWQNCDGNNSISDLAELLAAEVNAPVDARVVEMALDELAKFKLLDESTPNHVFMPQVTRRHVIRALGVATIALPAIVTIVAPRPADAATPCSAGQPCTVDADCCTAHPNCVTTGAPAGRGCRP